MPSLSTNRRHEVRQRLDRDDRADGRGVLGDTAVVVTDLPADDDRPRVVRRHERDVAVPNTP
jgi:hypothetical protein